MKFDIVTNEKINNGIQSIADFYNLNNSDLLHPPTREQRYVEARRSLIYFLTKMGLSWSESARLLNVNHATIMYHYRKFVELCEVGEYKDVKSIMDTALFGFQKSNVSLVDRIINCIFVTDFGMVNLEKTRLNLEKELS